MPLTNNIKPGDAVTVTALEDNFADLDAMLSAVVDSQLQDGAIDTRHMSGAYIYTTEEKVAGPVALGAIARLAPAALTSYPCEIGQPVYVIGSTRLDSTGAPGDGYLQVQVDAALVTQTLRRHYLALATGHHELHTIWAFVATAGTHDIELMAAGANCTANNTRLLILAVRR